MSYPNSWAEQRGATRVALVQDALPFLGGAERVLEAALEVFPEAAMFALVYNRKAFDGAAFARRQVHTSFIDRLPGARARYRSYLPLFPLAVEQFDLRPFEVILSFNYAVAHGVLAGSDQLHLTYTYTPLRQAWHHYQAYLEESGLRSGPKSWAVKIILHYLRLWDQSAASRVDHFVAVSKWVAQNIWRAYRRTAEVLYPPVDVERFRPHARRDDFFITVSRLEAHKKVAMIVEAFSRLGLPLLVVGEGQDFGRITRMAKSNVRLLGFQPDPIVQDLLGRARAFVMAASEDFGIAAVEAQAAGCPVIAYAKGGALETVIEGETGLYFAEQTVESLEAAVEEFVRQPDQFEASRIRRNAERFNRGRFQHELVALVEREWNRFGCQNHEDKASAFPIRHG